MNPYLIGADFLAYKHLHWYNEVQSLFAEVTDMSNPSGANFRVFISFKNSDSSGRTTADCIMANELYNALTKRGINTFFSNATLELLGASQYKQVIDDALDLCQILIAVGTSVDNLNSQWVKYEWDSFSNDILSGLCPNGSIFSYIDGITPHMLPRTLRQSQVFEKSSSSVEDICNYIEHTLGITPEPAITIQTAPPAAEEAGSGAAASLEDIYSVSHRFLKTNLSSLIEDNDRQRLETLTENYSELFSAISSIEHRGKETSPDCGLIKTLLDIILDSSAENIIKIEGSNGTEKIAIAQLLFIHTYLRALDGGRHIPFYINLSHYEKLCYNKLEKISAQMKKELSKDIRPFLDYIEQHPDCKPVIFIDGIRDFIFSKTLIEHILAEQLEHIPNLSKVVSVDTNLIFNAKRCKKVIALAPKNFEYIMRIHPVDLVDDEVCAKFYRAFEKIYGIDGFRIHEKMKKMAFYEIDAYVLRLAAGILSDNLNNNDFTISDLFEAICINIFNGSRETLLLAAETAYNFAYNEDEFEDGDVFSASYWVVIKRHKIFIEFLISYYYIHKLVAFDGNWDIDFFEQILPKEITRFVTPRLNDSYGNQEKLIKLCNNHYCSMGILGQSEMTYWLGRLKNQKLAAQATVILKRLYDETKEKITVRTAGDLYQNPNERKNDYFLLRCTSVSLIYCGYESISEEYICSMIDDDLPNTINRGFHLEYYSDKPYIPNKDMLDFEDDFRTGERTLKRLVKNIEQHLARNTGVPILSLDLFTMCSLIQARVGSIEHEPNFDIMPYLEKCLSFLEVFRKKSKGMSNRKISAYFDMIHTDFSEISRSGKRISVPCLVFNTFVRASETERTGWVNAGIPSPENIVEHMYNTWLLGMLNLPASCSDESYDKQRVLSMIMIHDLGETITGDIPKPEKVGNSTYDDNEDRVMRSFLLKGTYSGMTNLTDYYTLWEEWFAQKTFNAKVAKDLDVLQAMYQFCAYYIKHPDKFSDERRDSWLSEYQDLKTELGMELYQRIIRDNPNFSSIFS